MLVLERVWHPFPSGGAIISGNSIDVVAYWQYKNCLILFSIFDRY
jgi:hypothetical protein